jgi:hypothetical protein
LLDPLDLLILLRLIKISQMYAIKVVAVVVSRW